jgi:two-component system, NarL family, sensor histidine kinase DesK
MTSKRRRWPNIGGFFWVAVWLFPLLGALGTVGVTAKPAIVAGTALGVFCLIYTVLVWGAFDGFISKRHQVIGYVVIAAMGVTLASAYGDVWLLLLLYVATASATIFGDRPRPVLGTALVFAAIAATVTIGALKHVDASTYLADAVGMVLASALVFVVRQMSRLIYELRATREQLAESAVAEERLRFSRDLHDLLGHTLSLIVVKAEVVRRLAERDPAAAAAQAADIEQVGRRALVEIREAVTGYREAGLTAELSRARSALSAAGVEVFVRRTAGSLPGPTDALLAWVVREAVTNVVRHAQATECEIALHADKDVVTLSVTDNGRGPDGPHGSDGPRGPDGPVMGNGLRGLVERVSAAGGVLSTGAREGGGFRLEVTLPAAPSSSIPEPDASEPVRSRSVESTAGHA